MQASMHAVPTSAPDHHRRGRVRYRRAALTSGAAFLAKAAGLATTLLTIPVTAPYLGPERFGLFMTISSIPLLLSFSDFGIGNGLLTELSAADGRDDREHARVLVSSAFIMVLTISAVLLAISIPVLVFIPWHRVLNLQSPVAIAELPLSLFIFVLSTLAAAPLGIPQRVQQAYQRGFVPNLWLLAANVLTLGLLLECVWTGKGLPWLVGSMALSTLVTGILNWFVEFGGASAELRPRMREFRMHEAIRVGKAGLMIFSAQVGGALLLTLPVILLGRMYGQGVVGSYAVVQRILSAFLVVVSLLVTPLWPAYGEALARGDGNWVRRTYQRSLLLTLLLAGIPLAIAAVLAPRLVSLFSSRTLAAGHGLAAGVAVLCFCIALRHTISMMVNGCGYLRRTSFAFPAAVAFAASALLTPKGFLAPGSVPLWVAAAETIVIAVLLTDASRILRRLSRPA